MPKPACAVKRLSSRFRSDTSPPTQHPRAQSAHELPIRRRRYTAKCHLELVLGRARERVRDPTCMIETTVVIHPLPNPRNVVRGALRA